MRACFKNRRGPVLKQALRISITSLVLTLALTGCLTGPDYERPAVEVPDDWQWKQAEPGDHHPKGEWWTVFEDVHLDALQARAIEHNQDLRAAAARVEQARAAARMSRADLLPSIQNDNAWSRYRTSGNAPSPIGVPVESFIAEEWRVPFDLSYEIDLWGRVRRGFESARERALGAEAARQNVLLTLQADLAANYFNLIGVNEEIRTYQDAIELRREALTLFERRLEVGVGTEFQVERTKVELATAEADLAAARRRRAELRNALALLCGQPPAGFDTATADGLTNAPAIAPGLPSALLERRPDVAEAERELAASNARIGVAQAAFFPSISLTANGGLQSGELEDLLNWESRIWGIGPTISVPVFQGGRLKADLEQSRAAYEEAVAHYRQSILVAFRDVDDSLAAVRFLREQSDALQRAVDASRNAVRLAFDRYSAGTVNFLEVIDAEGGRLQNELARIRVATEQLTATVRLIKALGGGWEEPSTTL